MAMKHLKDSRKYQEYPWFWVILNMPKMDGLTLLNELQQFEWTDIKAIRVSAYGDLDNIRTAMNCGAYDFATKPIDFKDLETTIEKTLREIERIHQSR